MRAQRRSRARPGCADQFAFGPTSTPRITSRDAERTRDIFGASPSGASRLGSSPNPHRRASGRWQYDTLLRNAERR